jgi:hypothetical protein
MCLRDHVRFYLDGFVFCAFRIFIWFIGTHSLLKFALFGLLAISSGEF